MDPNDVTHSAIDFEFRIWTDGAQQVSLRALTSTRWLVDACARLVGGIIGGLGGLALLAALFIVLHRRRTSIRKRLTFHRDVAGQRRFSCAPMLTTAHSHPSRTTSSRGCRNRRKGRGREHENARWATAGAEHGAHRAIAAGPPPRGEAPRNDHGAPQQPLAAVFSAPMRTRRHPGARPHTPAARSRRPPMLRRRMEDLQLELDRASLRNAATTTASSM
ncbi:hypothetical protein BJ912DRAFT_1143784 [Pholiota molesta]|nr:hypothetical protein BJ912DRAFT_1143784 [Pholiota molesta]